MSIDDAGRLRIPYKRTGHDYAKKRRAVVSPPCAYLPPAFRSLFYKAGLPAIYNLQMTFLHVYGIMLNGRPESRQYFGVSPIDMNRKTRIIVLI